MPSYNENLQKLRNDVKRVIEDKQRKQKSRYDKKRVAGIKFVVGEQVLVRTAVGSNQGQSRKLLPKYSGPYVVTKVLENDRYAIEDVCGSTRAQKKYHGIVSVDKMKAYKIEISSNSSDDDGYSE